jgi:HEAT repeat protein
VRQEVAALLATLKLTDEVVTEALIGATTDNEALVVDAACFALGEMESRRSVDALILVAKNHDDARGRECAVAALGAIGDDRALDAILDALNDKPPIRRRAVVALSNFEGPRVDAALADAATDRDWQVRSAVDQLGIGEAREN